MPRPDHLTLSLGVADHESRRTALMELADEISSGSMSALICALADAYIEQPDMVADVMRRLWHVARDPAVYDDDGNVIAVRMWRNEETGEYVLLDIKADQEERLKVARQLMPLFKVYYDYDEEE